MSVQNNYTGGISLVFDILIDRILGKHKSIAGNFLTSNSFILEFLYKHTVFILFIIYSLITYNAFHDKTISCSSGYNNSEPSTDAYQFCLSYPFVCDEPNCKKKTYLLFYKWVPWTLLVIGITFHLPKCVVKSTSSGHISKFLAKISQEKSVSTKNISAFMQKNWNHFGAIYYANLLCHAIGIVVNIIVFYILDFCLQGRFATYVPRIYPFNRDIDTFTDDISHTFPPFAFCNISKEIRYGRIEEYKCHLLLMEYYEKIFVGIWFWIIFLSVVTFMYICFILCFNLPFVKMCIGDEDIKGVGNTFMLYKIKCLITPKQYKSLLTSLLTEKHHDWFTKSEICKV